MNILDIIAKKRDKQSLSKEEINYFVIEYVNDRISDYQASALIMAMYINGMSKEEITNFTLSMAQSGEILDLSKISNNIVDKHSTGGVGDKITIVLMPIIASLGIPVAKMSGRGLGFTGGTVDKLESIPGYKTQISIPEFIKQVENIGISLIGQTGNLAPADKKIYALRDATACVESTALIASSVMSKKIASGANKIILDVTVGSGAFMRTKEDALELAEIMKDIGYLANRETICVLTNMEEPIGKNVGNSLEIIETVECLKGNIPEDIKEIIMTLGSYIIKLAGKGDNIESNRNKIMENIENGRAYEKFLELVAHQGGDTEYIKNTDKFEKAKHILPVIANKSGYVQSLDARKVGMISVELGAGRIKKEDNIDKSVGIVINKKVSDRIQKDEILAYIHANNNEIGNKAVESLKEVYVIEDKKTEKQNHILDIVE